MTLSLGVDPAFCLGLLPKYLELKPAAILSPPPQEIERFQLYSEDHIKYFLSSLSNPGPICTLDFLDYGEFDYEFMKSVLAESVGETDAYYTWVFIRHHSLNALRDVGLDVHGGLEGLLETHRIQVNGVSKFPTYNIIVRDAETASRYVDIGVQVDLGLEIRLPDTWDEAAQQYMRIKNLIDGDDGVDVTEEQLMDQIFECPDENKRWRIRRELFRQRAKAKYQDILFDMTKQMEFEKFEKRHAYLDSNRKERNIAEDERQREQKHRVDAKVLQRMEIDAEDGNFFETYMLQEENKYGISALESALRKSRREMAARNLFGQEDTYIGTPSVSSEFDTFLPFSAMYQEPDITNLPSIFETLQAYKDAINRFVEEADLKV